MPNIEKLIQAYINEKSTSKLLHYESVVDDFNTLLRYHRNESENKITQTIEEIERERIGYFIKEYILVRFEKIKSNFFLDRNLMSLNEKKFFDSYIEIMKKSEIYVDSPSNDIDIVGFIAQEKIDGIKIDDQIVEVFAGDFFVGNYDDVKNYIKDGSVFLA